MAGRHRRLSKPKQVRRWSVEKPGCRRKLFQARLPSRPAPAWLVWQSTRKTPTCSMPGTVRDCSRARMGAQAGPTCSRTGTSECWPSIREAPAHSLRWLVIDPHNTAMAYAGTLLGVFQTTDGGANWTAVNAGLTNLNIHALALDPGDSNTLYAGTDSGVFEITFAPTVLLSLSQDGRGPGATRLAGRPCRCRRNSGILSHGSDRRKRHPSTSRHRPSN